MEFEEMPRDPVMLMSYINTKLRDVYKDLDDLCHDMHIDRAELERRLAEGGFEYSAEHRRFW